MDYGSVPEWTGLAAAFVGFRIALSQYREGIAQYKEAQAWKRADLVAAEADKLFSSEQVAPALLLIDYSAIRLDSSGRRTHDKSAHVFSDPEIISALAVHDEFVDGTERFDEHQMLIRTSFDALLTGIERLDHYIETKLITTEDATVHLRYWIPRMADPAKLWKDREFYVALHKYVDHYEYKGVRRMFAAFGIPVVT